VRDKALVLSAKILADMDANVQDLGAEGLLYGPKIASVLRAVASTAQIAHALVSNPQGDVNEIATHFGKMTMAEIVACQKRIIAEASEAKAEETQGEELDPVWARFAKPTTIADL